MFYLGEETHKSDGGSFKGHFTDQNKRKKGSLKGSTALNGDAVISVVVGEVRR